MCVSFFLFVQVFTFTPRLLGEGGQALFNFQGSSDAVIVKGLIAVLTRLYSGHSAAEILSINAKEEFSKIGLDGNLSAQRSNGLNAMIARIRNIADAYIK